MVVLITLIMSSLLYASELVSGEAAKSKNTISPKRSEPVELGGCRPQKISKAKPKAKLDDKSEDISEEFFARSEAEKAELSKEEILARLIYSESLSTGYWNGKCQAPSVEDIMKSIGWGAMSRIGVKLKSSLTAYPDVIFAKKQFRTSFSSAKENIFAISFLCPLKSQKYLDHSLKKPTAISLYAKAQETAKDIISEFESSGIPKKYKGVTNFFYPQSEFFGDKRPTWAAKPNPTENKGYMNILGVGEKPCVEYYRLK